MKLLTLLVVVLCSSLLSLHGASAGEGEPGSPGQITLNGKLHQVTWSDGDTLTIDSGRRKGKTARLVGYNTLESYGPVHRWGEWTRPELEKLATQGRLEAAERRWDCQLKGKKDTYGRLLLDCPDARRQLIERGLAHIFAYDSEPDPDDLEAQRHARVERLGIWEKGRPEHIVTNVAADDEGRVFLRIVNTRTGKTERKHQREDYEPCDEICHGPEVSGSCMLFIPYEQRYEKQPACIK